MKTGSENVCACGQHRDLPTRWFCAWFRMNARTLTQEQLGTLSWFLHSIRDDESRYPTA